MVDVILHQCLFGLGDGFLNGLQLLRDVQAFAPLLDHFDHAVEVAVRAAKALDHGRMRLMCVGVFHVDSYPPPQVTIRRPSPHRPTVKSSAHPDAPRPPWLGRSMRACVLLIILFGTLLSSLGVLQTHALAPLDAIQIAQAEQDDSHGHPHEGDPLAAYEGASHTHLGSDHSHDKAHALPAMSGLGMSAAPPWRPRTRAWIDRLMTHRLDRPPKTA